MLWMQSRDPDSPWQARRDMRTDLAVDCLRRNDFGPVRAIATNLTAAGAGRPRAPDGINRHTAMPVATEQRGSIGGPTRHNVRMDTELASASSTWSRRSRPAG